MARIISRSETVVSPWVRLVAKDVEVAPGSVDTYHCLGLADYVSILARMPDGRFPIVRQFRSAVEAETWELPAGMVDPGDTPESCCRRELLEETGLIAGTVRPLGAFYTDTGRLQNRIHSFAVEASAPDPTFAGEHGMTVDFVTAAELRARIRDGTFSHQLHLGTLALAGLEGLDGGILSG